MKTRLRRWLFLTHRWLGIVACTFFAMWFVSGMVMMYVGYPRLTDAERLAHLPPLPAGAALLTPRQALDAAGIAGPLRELRLAAARGGQAVYLAVPDTGAAAPAGQRPPPRGTGVVVVDAATGQRLQGVDPALALASAAAYAAGAAGLQYAGSVDEDAFTHSRALDAHRPLHKVQLADADRTLLYISGRTGEVVRDATRTERLWNYAGAWIHWLYPLRGNVFDAYWADIVNGLSILGIAMALAGTVVGVLRWRFGRPYRSGSRSPYPGRMMRWHHVSGLLFALVTIAWIFSGLMSMNPWRIFDTGAPPLRTAALQGGPLAIGSEDAAPAALLAAAHAAVGDVRELRWARTLGQATVLAQGATGRPVLLGSRSAQPRRLDPDALRAAAAGLVDAPLARVERLTAYDLHYYDRAPHTMTGGGDKPLPVWRLVFDDAHATWVHLDPHTGAVLGRTDSGRRTSRWLFAMLHSWDWLPLLERRPLWDAVLIALSLGGTLLSVTGVVVGWRRLGFKLRPARTGSRTD
ncbi:PepSY domain-containing protein [Pseudorhodoferax sp. Leaf274]|uniref:PepSY domain-containing protein n=1 Tax=Pseudorhodoferax sp. Leaf274 TaxID=1736318 RepID=UPI000703A4C8|nr:PepSY domain-containing protein [Pseudorhodoferax sp. Leaf274]KQP43701.1 peptidase [Pseudorhodoferax sp. Leaf274]